VTALQLLADGPFRVAVVGSGPSGLYAAEALAERGGSAVLVDVIDRLPTPFGLVRYGVAPDHLKIKAIVNTLHATFDRENVRFLGRLELGTDISALELRQHYHAVIYATGAQSDRRLGIEGEHLPGSHSATEFVSWYNGHPLGERHFDLSEVESVVVVGAGNVALDVARLLAKSADDLRHTDVPDNVLAVLAKSSVRDIHIVARRGPMQAKFSAKELRELGEIEAAGVRVAAGDVPDESVDLSALSRPERSNIATFRGWSDPDAESTERTVHFHFWRAPIQVLGTDSCVGIELRSVASGADGYAEADETVETIEAQLVIRAIGYRSLPLPGVPFDEVNAVIPNAAGRVLDSSGNPLPGQYVAGWLKRGPTGIIGTNRSDADETVTALLADLAATSHATHVTSPRPIDVLLAERKIPYTEFEGWQRIDAAERAAGPARGGTRVKIADWDELLRLAAIPDEDVVDDLAPPSE
jgi:ferredoxin/flavodoxin---NADP+ reductase